MRRYYKVSYIYRKGSGRSHYVKIVPGYYILAVRRQGIEIHRQLLELFNCFGRKFEFTVNSKPQMEGRGPSAWSRSPRTHGELEYARWVDERKAMVDKLSNGEIGYLHIRAMNAPSLQKFERDLLENQGKRALIIDERSTAAAESIRSCWRS